LQKFSRIYDYIHEYQKLVNDTYSQTGVSFLTTYYNINSNETIWDNDKIFGGSYERVGEYSGILFNKILLLPIYFPEEITTSFDGQDTGYYKEGETTITFPGTYGITPYPGDIIKLEQEYLNPNNDTYPTFLVEGVDISTNTEYRYWRLKLKIFQSVSTTEIEDQVENVYTYFDYDKKLHTLADSQFLAKVLIKSELLKTNLKSLFDQNSGFYFV